MNVTTKCEQIKKILQQLPNGETYYINHYIDNNLEIPRNVTIKVPGSDIYLFVLHKLPNENYFLMSSIYPPEFRTAQDVMEAGGVCITSVCSLKNMECLIAEQNVVNSRNVDVLHDKLTQKTLQYLDKNLIVDVFAYFVDLDMQSLSQQQSNKIKNIIAMMHTQNCTLWKDDVEMQKWFESMAIRHNNKVRQAKKNIPKKLKTEVWNQYVGEDIGSTLCLCCNKTKITQSNFHCGHILAEANGGTTHISNLKPICAQCNLSMGIKNMNDFSKLFE